MFVSIKVQMSHKKSSVLFFHSYIDFIAQPLLMIQLQHLDKFLLVLEVVLMNTFGHSQFGSLIQRGLIGIRCLLGAMQQQHPFEEFACGFLVVIVKHYFKLPCSPRVLRPGMSGHEGPFSEAFLRF